MALIRSADCRATTLQRQGQAREEQPRVGVHLRLPERRRSGHSQGPAALPISESSIAAKEAINTSMVSGRYTYTVAATTSKGTLRRRRCGPLSEGQHSGLTFAPRGLVGSSGSLPVVDHQTPCMFIV